MGHVNFGSSLSVRNVLRFNDLKATRVTVNKLEFNDPANKAKYAEATSQGISFYVDGMRSITMTKESAETAGGVLHGLWRSDEVISSSDERLKKDIVNLHRHLDKATLKRSAPSSDADKSTWVLRQLRPVSYQYKAGVSEGKASSNATRFGFIAQDLEKVLPELVRTLEKHEGDLKDRKAVVYQDILAVLTAALQTQLWTVEKHEKTIADQESSSRGNRIKFETLQNETKLLRDKMSSAKLGKEATQGRVGILQKQMALVRTTQSCVSLAL